MNRVYGLTLAWSALLIGSLVMVNPAEAGRRHRGCGHGGGSYGGGSGCNTGYDAGCNTAGYAPAADYAPAPAPEPITVTKTIMVPQTVYETMTVTVPVWKPVTRTKTITVYRNVPKTRDITRTVTEYVNVPQTRTETYFVNVPTWKEVTRDVTTMVPEMEAREGTRRVCRPVMVTENRTVCRDQGSYESRTYTDCCGCSRTCNVWVPNMVQEEVPVQVCKPEISEETYTYHVRVCKPVTESRTFKVCEMVREEKSREVQFVSVEAKQVEKTFTQNYVERVAEEKEVNYVENVQETQERQVRVAKQVMVPKEVTYTYYPNQGGYGNQGCGHVQPICGGCR